MDRRISVSHARDQLIPTLADILLAIADDDLNAGVFFAQCLNDLREVETEDELLELFFRLSTTAFQGFTFSPSTVSSIDAVLEQAQNMAALFAAPDGIQH